MIDWNPSLRAALLGALAASLLVTITGCESAEFFEVKATLLWTSPGDVSPAISTDGVNVYWGGDHLVQSCPVGGCVDGQPETVSESTLRPMGVSATADGLYWANPEGGTVMYCGLVDCHDSATVYATVAGGKITAFTVDASESYFADGQGNVFFCPLTGCLMDASSGTPMPTLLTSGQGNIQSLASDGTSLYWMTSDGTLKRFVLSGGALTTLTTFETKPSDLKVDDVNVYWTESRESGAIRSCAIQGCGGSPHTFASAVFPSAVAVGGGSVYWNGGFGIVQCPQNGCDGAEPTPVASLNGLVTALALDATTVYATASYPGAVWKAPR